MLTLHEDGKNDISLDISDLLMVSYSTEIDKESGVEKMVAFLVFKSGGAYKTTIKGGHAEQLKQAIEGKSNVA